MVHQPDLPVDFPPTDMEASEDVAERTRLRLSSTTLSRSITFMSRDSTWGGVSGDNLADVFQSWKSSDEEHQSLAQIASQAIEEQVEAGASSLVKLGEIVINEFESIISYMKKDNNHYDLKAFQENTSLLDSWRNEDFQATFPERFQIIQRQVHRRQV